MADPTGPAAAGAKAATPLTNEQKMDVYFGKAAKTFAKKIQDVLPRITAGNHRRLAIRNYVRFADRVDKRWAMTNAEETAFKATTTYQTLESERKKIFKKFAAVNTGHSLKARSEARSLETQTRYWNGNATVKALGAALRTQALGEIGKKTYPDVPTDADVTTFKKWLKTVTMSASVPVGKAGKDGKRKTKTYKSPTHATPGLSSHGRIRALDFTVWKGSTQVAGTTTETAQTKWDTPGWTKKLKEAIEAVSSDWDGPLASPYEPWHWTYTGK